MTGLAVLATASVVILSCKKNADPEPPDGTVVQNTPAEMQMSWDVSHTGSRARLCDEEGGITSLTLEWELGTCRSNCTRGIGFRCGRRIIAGCRNGSIEVFTHNGSCPNGASAYSRTMRASLSFYTNGHVKLTFLKAMPLTETGNTNFEIESEEFVDLPDGILLDRVPYDGVLLRAGIYKIDYSDGIYGSVILPATLIPQK